MYRLLDQLFTTPGWSVPTPRTDLVIVNGGCPTGADHFARHWALDTSVECETYMADWGKHGNAAGPIRNKEMAELGAELCILFPGGKGTMSMYTEARKAGIPVLEVFK